MAVVAKLIGLVSVVAAIFIFLYYTTWTVVLVSKQLASFRELFLFILFCFWQPYLGSDHPLAVYFLDRKYAIYIPAAILATALVLVAAFIKIVIAGENSKKKSKWDICGMVIATGVICVICAATTTLVVFYGSKWMYSLVYFKLFYHLTF